MQTLALARQYVLKRTTADDHFDPAGAKLVRQYSDEIANAMPGNVPEHAIATHETELQADEHKPAAWRHWLRFEPPESSDFVVANLQAGAKEATDLWKKLQLDIGDLGARGEQIPTVETLWTAVRQAQTQWDKKKEKGFGRAKAHLFSFFETMNEHKYLFSIIPNGDKYTSLITGVITSIVKASVNHESIAEGFSRALQEISRDLDFVRRGTRMCNTTEMKGHVVSLYREVFAFLCYTMKWMIGDQITTMPKANTQHKLNDSKLKKSLMGKVDDTMRVMATRSSNAAVIITREDLEWLQQSLDPFVEDGKRGISSDSMLTDIPLIPNEVAVDIQSWAQSEDSNLLWVEGPAYGVFDEALPSIACQIQAISEDLGIPCISVFAKTKYTFESNAISIKDAGIISMLYSLIVQLINIIPTTFEAVEGLVGDKLQRLDGTVQSIPTAIGTLKALLSVIEPGLVCVICGFELVDCREHLSALEEFIQILREQPVERRLKALFLSQGNCRALSNMTNLKERSDATRMVQGRGRSPLAGAVAAKDISARVRK
ncbi:hypothetical protein F4781DRAFT_72887 [Annulohypoxylon bovei var. microspora]|nr:hypothetical protein F4781DRAFT_72887 [Annulohypoxylon bovei var. microspora]